VFSVKFYLEEDSVVINKFLRKWQGGSIAENY